MSTLRVAHNAPTGAAAMPLGMGSSVPPHCHAANADPVEHSAPPLGLYFPDRGAYDAWAEHVDDEAPGLRTRLLTVDAPDGGQVVFFRLVDRRASLTSDGEDALWDIARRVVACRPARRGA